MELGYYKREPKSNEYQRGFDAGRAVSLNENLGNFNAGRKVGIKEVVEFIGEGPFEHNHSMYGHQMDDCFACRYEAKLKEWNISGD